MEIKKDTEVKVPYRPELGTGAVLQVAEGPGEEWREKYPYGVGDGVDYVE